MSDKDKLLDRAWLLLLEAKSYSDDRIFRLRVEDLMKEIAEELKR